ncbi:uncharacterized protein LOC120258995 [Dioscorea cayenensis subsp. rotundata]|uniref:Uncharacterized protein LOC120258995 n=1 Tax=Dioscorea cayennensis subsp. rotundata TaxID=55577 RepID=A0AB40B5Z5_DIOCR|nr:uncharacterized protein LOC120258995 [Dioscorea cayenensis subsp. rotundata]
MASAACSSTCIPRPELLGRSQSLYNGKPHLKPCIDVRVLDISSCGAPRSQQIFPGKNALRLTSIKDKGLSSVWKHCFQIPKKSYLKGCFDEMQHTFLTKAVATMEPNCSSQTENGCRYGSNPELGSDSNPQVFQSSIDVSIEMDDREKLRRMRISKANKGNVPWNKGRKHSEETLRKIRERTRIAMQDPKVRMKLVNLGHAQSEETRIKIGVGVREGWQRRRQKQMVQESCLFEWQNLIAQTSRKGYYGEDELQWDSYELLDEKLKQEWLESIEMRKSMPRPKGSKRAPKSADQRRKISEAISAKWADPEYRARVCAALSKYHGTTSGVERKRRSKPSGESVKREPLRMRTSKSKESKYEAKIVKKTTRTRNATPSYRDPLASSKLEMIKNIKAQREAMENKKREATERAKLLIAEAEKAAKALEIAALKSPLAQASLLETRKLIAEATKSIQSIENGKMILLEKAEDVSISAGGLVNNSQLSSGLSNNDDFSVEHVVNGNPIKMSNGRFIVGSQSERSDGDPRKYEIENAEYSSIAKPQFSSHDVQKFHSADLLANAFKLNGSMRYENLTSDSDEETASDVNSGETISASATTKTKKWVCGRLVEVEENQTTIGEHDFLEA